jgi:epoxyqueuosine reductase
MMPGQPAEDEVWSTVGEALDGLGWRWRVVAVERLADAAQRIEGALAEAGDSPDDELLHAARCELPDGVGDARSIVIGAVGRPATPASLVVDGAERAVMIPPHYAGYNETPLRFAALVAEALARFGHRCDVARLPLKTLATGSGLALYGRNNISYVPGLGSYMTLAACATDAPAPPTATWEAPAALSACLRCFACARICPTGAITGARFVIDHDRCLTTLNESDAPFPDWVEPHWHTCAVGCLECQRVCPQNVPVGMRVDRPVRFDEVESAAIVAGDEAALALLAGERPDFEARRAACGLDYEPGPMGRNIRALLGAGSSSQTGR